MKIPRELDEQLKELGLSPNEIKVYLLLLNVGSLSAKEISEYSGVPFSKIYIVLRNLERKGWIESIYDRPIKYIARPPAEAVKNAITNMEKRIEEAAEYVSKVLQPIYEEKILPEKPEVWIFHGERNISMKIIDLMSKTREELLLALHLKLNTLINHYSKLVNRFTYPSDIRVRMLIPESLVDDMSVFKKFGIEIRCRGEMYGGGVISDRREALILLDSGHKISTAIWSTHISLIELAKMYFERLWEASKEI